MRVLVVEDEARIASFLLKGLRRSGYDAEHVETGKGALETVCDGGAYDLMLLDLGLPDVDGLEVLSQIRRQGIELPVIVLTAREADRSEGLRLGADEYLVKPVSVGELLGRVQALIG